MRLKLLKFSGETREGRIVLDRDLRNVGRRIVNRWKRDPETLAGKAVDEHRIGNQILLFDDDVARIGKLSNVNQRGSEGVGPLERSVLAGNLAVVLNQVGGVLKLSYSDREPSGS